MLYSTGIPCNYFVDQHDLRVIVQSLCRCNTQYRLVRFTTVILLLLHTLNLSFFHFSCFNRKQHWLLDNLHTYKYLHLSFKTKINYKNRLLSNLQNFPCSYILYNTFNNHLILRFLKKILMLYTKT